MGARTQHPLYLQGDENQQTGVNGTGDEWKLAGLQGIQARCKSDFTCKLFEIAKKSTQPWQWQS